jgi:hypothetical protein
MSSLVDLYTKSTPKTGKIDAKGTDKSILENTKSDDNTLEKSRHGKLGTGAGGYDNKKTYSSQIKK